MEANLGAQPFDGFHLGVGGAFRHEDDALPSDPAESKGNSSAMVASRSSDDAGGPLGII